jgi:hypothetical protein
LDDPRYHNLIRAYFEQMLEVKAWSARTLLQ